MSKRSLVGNVGPVLALLLVASMVVAAGDPTPHRAPGDDPLVLFGKMMPVLTHPRCLNCHGGVNPFAGPGHPGGIVDTVGIRPNASCNSCHDAAADFKWHTALPSNSFVGKDNKAMCAHIADFVMHTGRVSFIDHMQNDELVKFGFLGLMAGARDPSVPGDLPADPPPMNQAAFLKVAQEWVDDGMAGCVREGTITQTETLGSRDTFMIGPAQHTVDQTGDHRATIRLVNGRFQAKLEASGRVVHRMVGRIPAETGPCTMTTTTTVVWGGTTEGPAVVRMKVLPTGQGWSISARQVEPEGRDYSIEVTGPPERIRQTTTNVYATTCPGLTLPPNDSEVADDDSPAWTFTIEGHLRDDADPRRLVGACAKTMHQLRSDPNNVFICFRYPANHSPWMYEHNPWAGNIDGTYPTVNIRTEWNVRYNARGTSP